VIHDLETLESLFYPRRGGRDLRLLCLVEPTPRAASWQREVVVTVEEDPARLTPLCEGGEERAHAGVLAPDSYHAHAAWSLGVGSSEFGAGGRGRALLPPRAAAGPARRRQPRVTGDGVAVWLRARQQCDGRRTGRPTRGCVSVSCLLQRAGCLLCLPSSAALHNYALAGRKWSCVLAHSPIY
jgi:hypothetical protein